MTSDGVVAPRSSGREEATAELAAGNRRPSAPQGVAAPLRASDLSDDPFEQFARWFSEADADARIAIAEAACLSTLGPDGTPEGRMVLVKGIAPPGFVFYTNAESRKGRSLAAHPRAGLTFYWEPAGRQVRVRGPVESVSAEEADVYFGSRHRGSRIGAWASSQSRELASRADLEASVQEIEARFRSGPVPRPAHWVGRRIVPDAIEFWQEGQFRLHDRFAYARGSSGAWARKRLFP